MKRIHILFSLLSLSLLPVTLQAQCIDFTDLRSSGVTCTYGTFYNPYANVGIIDDGPSASSSRHTIHTNSNETDPRTNNKLHTVPPGEYASVRLGNWSVGAQAESITYEYKVNEEKNPILVFRYAAVMEDPNHTPEDQPRLTLEILDSNNKLVDSYCGAFDFISSESLGWNKGVGSVLWKDWTAVGLDLSAYSGQTIYIRFTTYDCERSGHFGYAYLNIACQQKKIQSLTCGYDNQTTLSGPDGFEYKWYTYEGETRKFVGNTQSITVPTDETLYYCEVNQTGKPTCSYTLSAQADPRVPLANYSYQRRGTCVDTLFLTNLSGVSADGQLLKTPHEDCDEYIWDLGDGRVITAKDINQPIVYENSGTYKVKLTAKLLNGNCVDVCERSIHMFGYNDTHTTEIYKTICNTEYYMFDQDKLNTSGTYTHYIQTSYGCDSTVILHLTANPAYYYDLEETICDDRTYDFHGRILKETGIYYDSLQTAAGCDSIYRLVLHKYPTFYSEKKETICDNQTYNFFGRELSETGEYYEKYISSHGCDSVYKLDLTVNKTYSFEETATICDHEKYKFQGKFYNQSGVYRDTFPTIYGCDSVYILNLRVRKSIRDTVRASICLGNHYDFAGRTLDNDGIYSDTIYDPVGRGCEVNTLILRTVASTVISTARVDDACADDELYQIKYQYTGATPVSYSLHYDQKARMMGFRDVLNAPFTIAIYDSIPQFADKIYLRPDKYNVRIVFDNGTCDPSQSVYDLSFMIKYPSWVIEQNWNDVVAVLNQDYNGGYTFKQYDWYVNNKIFEENTKSYLYAPQYLHAGDRVYAQLTRTDDDVAICTCPILIRDMSNELKSEEPILISLNRSQHRLQIASQEPFTGGIYDLYGHLIMDVVGSGKENMYIDLQSLQKGLYIVHCTSGKNRAGYKFVW